MVREQPRKDYPLPACVLERPPRSGQTGWPLVGGPSHGGVFPTKEAGLVERLESGRRRGREVQDPTTPTP
ncbi:hypothetical protein A3H56_01160 [Candidatus Nomurabacteria bacterium RIFCSPLOWO2_02_FULL_42_24]|nr:MAG: hypothetical protein A3H56_01160 [Candidatus Nomurabacteria bacterium RIFCSPLOWO2_02_FULL_42_24]